VPAHAPQPRRYRIVVRGRLSDHLASAFEGLQVDWLQGESALTGPIVDQAHLHGVLDRLRDLGIPLVSVNPVE
jgi:hypothetical protein